VSISPQTQAGPAWWHARRLVLAGRCSGATGKHRSPKLWIAAGASPKEVAARAGHTSVSFTLDRYGHLYPEVDEALRSRLDALFVDGRGTGRRVIELPR
jgi:hypothetical protein